jgi:hypothetical protein
MAAAAEEEEEEEEEEANMAYGIQRWILSIFGSPHTR